MFYIRKTQVLGSGRDLAKAEISRTGPSEAPFRAICAETISLYEFHKGKTKVLGSGRDLANAGYSALAPPRPRFSRGRVGAMLRQAHRHRTKG